MTETVRKPSLVTRLRDLIAGDSGFTLLETLAVMVIVGLLAAITVPQIAKWREKAYITALKTDARNVANAVEAFYVDDQAYPTQAQFNVLVGTGSADVKLNPVIVGAGTPQGCQAAAGATMEWGVCSFSTYIHPRPTVMSNTTILLVHPSGSIRKYILIGDLSQS